MSLPFLWNLQAFMKILSCVILLAALRAVGQVPSAMAPIMSNSFFDDNKTVPPTILNQTDILSGFIDNYTGESVTFIKVDTYKDGTAMTSGKVDGTIYRKKGANYYRRVYSGAVNVRWFGARGDGRTDDTEAIQKAVDFSEHVYIPRGQYQVSGIVVARKGVSIVGDGRESSILYAISKQNFVLALRNPANTSGVVEDINISDLKIDGGYSSKYGLLSNIIFSVVQRVNVTSCTEYGIYHYMGYTSTYRDCSVRYCGVAGLNVFQEGNLLLFERCVFSNNKGSGIIHTSGSTNTFLACSIENNAAYGVLLSYQSNPSIKYPPFSKTHSDLINIISCFFENNGSANRRVFSNIRIKGEPDPGVLKVRNTIVKGCHFGLSSGERAIDLAGDLINVTIEDNLFGFNAPLSSPPVLVGSFFSNNIKRVISAITFRNNTLQSDQIEIMSAPSPQFSKNSIADLINAAQRTTVILDGLSLFIQKTDKKATINITGTCIRNIDQNVDMSKTGIIVNTVDTILLRNLKEHGFVFETRPLIAGNVFYLKVPAEKVFNNFIVDINTY
jgi:hypothetical protein